MIKFFRHIRKSLLMETGKTSKYFKYAIGEIVLVVIGILIALSINTWNENKKTKSYEVKMLSEIAKALDSDINYFKFSSKRLQSLDSASTHFIRLVHEKSTFNDTLYKAGFSRWYYLRAGINYLYNPGPYEALKSSGLDRVSNDSLRNNLINFYDFESPRREALIQHYDREYEDDVAKLESFLGDPFTEEEDGEIKIYSKFPEDLFLNIDFLELLRNINTRAKISGSAVNSHIPKMENLRDQIKSEINQ